LTSLAVNRKVVTNCIEVSSLGLISDISNFLKIINVASMSSVVKLKICKSAIDHSFQIYCNRNNNIIPV
jgi:hypothetical protein